MFRAAAIAIVAILIPTVIVATTGDNRCFHDCVVTEEGYGLIRTFEGYSPYVYKDAVGVPTIGFGHAIQSGEHIKVPLMGLEAQELLVHDVTARTEKLNQIIERPLAPSQFDALASFVYNVGFENLERSTLLKRVNAGEDSDVHPEFLLWDHAGGKVLKALWVRRQEEASRYDSGMEQ